MPVKVQIDTDSAITPAIQYIWDIFARHFSFQYIFVKDAPDLLITEEGNGDIRVSYRFGDMLRKKQFEHRHCFDQEPLFFCNDGQPDYLGWRY